MQTKLFIAKLLILLIATNSIKSQVSISDKDNQTAHPSSVLELISDDKGLLLPRMETSQRDEITSPAQSLIIFNTTKNCIEIFVGGEWNEFWCYEEGPFTGACEGFDDGVEHGGQTYPVVEIGDQCWFAENLNIGDMIPSNTNQGTSCVNIEKYCESNDIDNCNNYGGVYQWDQAMCGSSTEGAQGICPEGWHIPTHFEWTDMELYICNYAGNSNCETEFPYNYTTTLGRGTNEGAMLKSCRQVDSPLGDECDTEEDPRWNSNDNHHGTDYFGFSSVPHGYRINTGGFNYYRRTTYIWTSTEYHDDSSQAWLRFSRNTNSNISRSQYNKLWGLSVRCIKSSE